MKAYLITHLVIYIIAVATQKRHSESLTDGVLALTFVVRVGLIAWTIYMLCEVLP
jgi:hypothetical protein